MSWYAYSWGESWKLRGLLLPSMLHAKGGGQHYIFMKQSKTISITTRPCIASYGGAVKWAGAILLMFAHVQSTLIKGAGLECLIIAPLVFPVVVLIALSGFGVRIAHISRGGGLVDLSLLRVQDHILLLQA